MCADIFEGALHVGQSSLDGGRAIPHIRWRELHLYNERIRKNVFARKTTGRVRLISHDDGTSYARSGVARGGHQSSILHREPFLVSASSIYPSPILASDRRIVTTQPMSSSMAHQRLQISFPSRSRHLPRYQLNGKRPGVAPWASASAQHGRWTEHMLSTKHDKEIVSIAMPALAAMLLEPIMGTISCGEVILGHSQWED